MAADVVALAVARSRRHRLEAERVAALADAYWARLDAADLAGSWEAVVGGPTVAAVTAGQLRAATDAAGYVGAATAAQGAAAAPAAVVPARTFAGLAADGRDLRSLLYLPVIGTKWRIGQGMTVADALGYGRRQLRLIAVSETQAAGRVADGMALALEPRVTEYVRQVNLPSCGRCILLAGRVYRRNAGFKRHPRCDCIHVPVIGTGRPGTQDPGELFRGMSADEQDAAFGAGEAAAIRAGADMGRVVNATRGMKAPGELPPGRRRPGKPTPARLLDEYGDDPGALRDALHRFGYF